VWLAALAVLLLLPFTLVDVPPVLDYPNHLARIFVLAHPYDPILSRMYAPHWSILPNLGFDAIGVVLLKILPVHVGGRVLLAISLLAPPLGVMAYSRAAFGRITGWALASSLAAFNGVFALGFMNFLLSLGLAFGAAGLWLALRRRGWTKAVITGACASVVVFFCHIFGVLLFAALIGCAELERLWQARRTLHASDVMRAALLLALTLAPALILYGLSPLSGTGAGAVEWADLSRKSWEIFTAFMTPSKAVTLLTGFCVFGFLILHLRGARFAPGARPALLLLALIFIAAPDTLKGGTFMDVRLALMFGLLLFAGIAPAPAPPRPKLWAVLLALLLVMRTSVVAQNWLAHRQDLADLRAAIAFVPPGTKVLAAQGEAPDRLVMPGLYRLDSHLPALLLIERRAFWPLLFADPSQQPLMVRLPYYAIAQPALADTVDWPGLAQPISADTAAHTPYLKNWQDNFDYVLLIEPPAAGSIPAGLTLVHAGGIAALYRIAR
jgi:hypothetical protein